MSLFRTEYKDRQGLTEKVKVEKLTTNVKKGIELFANRLDPAVVSEIKDWADDPELSKLLKKLQSLTDWQQFLNHYAEAMVARYLIKSKCKLEYEYPTCNDKQADFRAYQGDISFFIHIKRLNTDGKTQKQINIQKRFKALEQIEKPYTIAIQVFHNLTDLQSQHFVRVSTNFIKGEVQIGDSKDIYDDNRMYLGKCEILAIHNKEHILQLRTWVGHIDDHKRLYNKFEDANEQFMPGQLNIILITGLYSDQIEDFEDSLLGSNGFWSPDRHVDSKVVGWFNFGTKADSINFKMRYRENYQVPETINILFEKKTL